MMTSMPTNEDLLFAEHVVRAGFLTQEEVEESLSVQRRMEEMGVRDSLRNVLVKRGVLREADAAVVSRAAGLRHGGEPIPGYTLEARLGTGAMGSVYKAWQKGMKRHVAVKILRRDLTDDPRQVERLQREAMLVGKLDHPNIVRGLDSGESHGLVWFAMELVDGETLRQRISRTGPIPHAEAVRMTRQLAEALEHAFAHGVVHRDIKPGNILLTKDGVPRLTDYGLAKGESDDALTQLDATLGTPQYISPEQARNPRDADIRSDIYSLGATLHTMLSGRPPFEGETMAATLTKVLYERPRPLAETAPGTPEPVVYVVERMMAKDRRHRYQTATELVRDLRALEEGRLHVPFGFKGDIEQFVEKRRHRRMWLTGAALVTLAVTIAAGMLAWDRVDRERRRHDEAEGRLADLLQVAGPRETWDGPTVTRMIGELETLRTDFPGTPAADRALAELEHWRRQERAFDRALELARTIHDPAVDRLRLLGELDEALRKARADPDASVAARRFAELIGLVREMRDRSAQHQWDVATEDAAKLPLDLAAARLDLAETSIRRSYAAGDPAPAADEARVLAERFRRAAALVERHFAAYERELEPGGGFSRGEFTRLRELLESSTHAAREDRALSEMLANLPPPGTRSGTIADRRARHAERLAEASAARWAEVRREVEEMRGRREWQAAVVRLEEFAERALPEQGTEALAVRDALRSEQSEKERTLEAATAEVAGKLMDAVGRRDTPRAREVLSELSALAAGWNVPDNSASVVHAAGARLLDLVERHAWDALRARLASGRPLEQGLRVRTGKGSIGYRDVKVVQVRGRDVTFTHGGGQPMTVPLEEIALEDVVRYAGLTRDDPERALVLAAMTITEFQLPPDAREALAPLAEAGRALDAARADDGVAPIVLLLSRLREKHVAAVQAEMLDAESKAGLVHAAAVAAIDAGRYDQAVLGFESLLGVARYLRTEFVQQRRDEIRSDLARAKRLRTTENYAAHFPGSQFTQAPDGSAEILWDFEAPELSAPEGRRVLGLVEGHVDIGSRVLVPLDLPRVVQPEASPPLPLHLEHVLRFAGFDAAEARDTRAVITSPFQPRGRIEVSFLYRSEDPFFLAVSAAGMTAGILSAPDNPFAGRGVQIWAATDLDRPDLAFDDRHRSTRLAENPQALRKEGDTRFFHFEPGRVYRVRFVKLERRAELYVDEKLRAALDFLSLPRGPLLGEVVLLSQGPCEVDDLRVSGILDPAWLESR